MERYQKRFKALGSDVVVTLVTANESRAAVILASLETAVMRFEQRFSRFRQDSELTLVNRSAGRPTRVSAPFADLYQAALDYAGRTDGLYNPFILPDLQRAGYVSSWTDPANQAPDFSAGIAVVASAAHLEEGTLTLPAHSALDFGGIGKGYLARELTLQVPPDIEGYWLSLGGDIAVRGQDIGARPFSVAIAHATDPSRIVDTLDLGASPYLAMATSGTTKRRGTHKGHAWHHLIDPRTHKPAETDVASASAVAADPVTADIAAKCFVIAGTSKAQWVMDTLDVKYVILQRQTNSEITTVNLGTRPS